MLPIAPEGWGFILVPLVLAGLVAWAGWLKLAIAFAGLAVFMAFFFRDPERTAPAVPGAILAPADGKVGDIRATENDPFVGAAQTGTLRPKAAAPSRISRNDRTYLVIPMTPMFTVVHSNTPLRTPLYAAPDGSRRRRIRSRTP